MALTDQGFRDALTKRPNADEFPDPGSGPTDGDPLDPLEVELRQLFEREILEDAAAQLLELLWRDFEDKDDPVAAWRAWEYCRTKGWAIPGWVAGYFDRAGAEITRWPLRPPTGNLAQEVGRLLGFAFDKLKDNPLTRTRHRAEGQVWFGYYVKARKDGLNRHAAREWIAPEFGFTESTVRRRLKQFAINQGSSIEALATDRADEFLAVYRSASRRRPSRTDQAPRVRRSLCVRASNGARLDRGWSQADRAGTAAGPI